MPSKKQYNLVHNDEYDTRIPLYSDESFHRGIIFQAKFIGSMEVPRPTSRLEIMAAMRRIRYEFKAKGIKKKKVTLEVSVEGVKITLRKKKKKQHWMDENKMYLMQHPIYRIFYVSHDSQDLKIFSYIARDGNSNSFKCNVFKSSKKELRDLVHYYHPPRADYTKNETWNYPEDESELSLVNFENINTTEKKFGKIFRKSLKKLKEKTSEGRIKIEKSQAMKVVRTVGQAFEVCHKLSTNAVTDEKEKGDNDRNSRNSETLHPEDDYDDQEEVGSDLPQSSPTSLHKDMSFLGDSEDVISDQAAAPCLLRSHEVPITTASASSVGQSPTGTVTSECSGFLAGGELTALKHEIQLLRERLDQQNQQTRAAVAHARLLQDQLAAETAARIEAQTRTHQLLVQNKELLEHISALVGHLREQERLSSGHITGQTQVLGSPNVSLQTPTIPDLSSLGQRPGGQNSPWEQDPPSFPYCSYQPYPTESMLYPGNSSTMGLQGTNNCTDQLHFQTQLLERLHNISPYQLQRSPYTSPSPYGVGPGLLFPPSSRHSNSSQFSPGSMSLRVSQSNSFTSSPVMSQKMDKYVITSSELNQMMHEGNYTKSLSTENRNSSADTKNKIKTVYDEIPPILLDPPPQGRRNENRPKKEMQSSRNNVTIKEEKVLQNQKVIKGEKQLANVLRTPGPPPSRTTSARLPPRNDLMGQVKRTTWARHTTK